MHARKVSPRWEIMFTAGPEAHKLFRCLATGRLAIADRSGRLPEDTDDGVLWVDDRGPMEMVSGGRVGTRPTVWIPLTVDDDGRESRTPSDLGLALQIQELMGLAIVTRVKGRVFKLVEAREYEQ